MDSNCKHTYVLIAGAWHGGWAWRDVIPGLRDRGHAVTAPTLTGLGERRHNGTDDTNLSTHIDDVIAHIEMEGLQSVTLVGWSYGGMVITGVAARIPDKIKSLIYVDAFVPEDGKALVDYIAAEQRVQLDLLMNEGKSLPPIPLDVFGVTEPSLVEFVTPRLTPQPPRTFYEPVKARPFPPNISVAYVYCSGYQPLFTSFYERLKGDPRVRTAVIDTGHHCMLSEPLKTIEVLSDLA
ncbi:alpha/beta hydrolase [Paraburkholderia strydomiana]|uniref:alpha/beta hydrolase n=1 Tax=Paraburkholderia strydomiana TaxID=1245417 RepID=UPI001BECC6F4|nr:alpha/beta hydrolase [Paraburkholderia strydomiana]MBT2790113.1 alpha/beta hydrolase [Paraburkholderia strydomiana]